MNVKSFWQLSLILQLYLSASGTPPETNTYPFMKRIQSTCLSGKTHNNWEY